MSPEAWVTVAVTLSVFALLATDRYPSEGIVLGGLVVLLVGGILPPEHAFAGFSNPGVVALAAVYVITAALRVTGALDGPSRRLLHKTRSVPAARVRLTAVVASLSAVVNNTPVVGMFMPVAGAWARRHRQSVRGLLLPLSYAAVFGGACTLLGSSTHLVVHGLLLSHEMPGMGLFELLPVGLPVALICVPASWLLARRLLDRPAAAPNTDAEARRDYTADLKVAADAPFIGMSVEEADLRHLPGLYLIRIERGAEIIAPVRPSEPLQAGDRLTFTGQLDTLVDLQRRRGLRTPQARHASAGWVLHEAVISRGSRLVGRSIRELGFRSRYNAAVVAVHRHGEHVDTRVGDIALRHGDTLLLQAAPGFAAAWRDSGDFYVVSALSASERPRHGRAPLAVLILAAVMALAATGVLPLASAAAAGALLAVLGGCLSPGQARRALDVSVLVVVASALGIARALEQTGVAAVLAETIASASVGLGPVGMLALIYLTGMLLTELITNTAAAALLFPVAIGVAGAAALDPRPFVLATSISAAISLATPLGYQTNMMVYGPGGYRFVDFLKMGLPLQALSGAIAVTCLAGLYGLW